MKKNKILMGLLFLLVLMSCSKEWLDKKSNVKLLVPNTLSDFQGLLDNIAIMNATVPVRGEVASDGHFVSDVTYSARAKSYVTDAYIWSKTTTHQSTISNWSEPYTRVLYLNIILDGLMKNGSELSKEKDFENIKGQALFQRARTFFELAQNYAIPYSESNRDQPYGIVLRLTSEIDKPSIRSTIAETYSQIVNDLISAKDLLPERSVVPTRASKLSALALLARVYLSMKEYEKALTNADDALKIYSALLNFNDISVNANFIGRYNTEVIFHAQYTEQFLSSSCLIDKSLYDLYDMNDLRKSRYFKVNPNGTITFKGNYESLTTTIFCGLATDELYLIRSECFARLNKVTEAMNDLNTLLKSRWNKAVTYPVVTASNSVNAIKTIIQERRKELLLRATRWSDLRRLNQEPGFETTLKRTVLGSEYVLEPNSYKYTFPIPDDIIEQTKIQQNPGWP